MSKVEDYFITPLEAHYEVQPKEGPRQTIIEDLEQFSEDELHEAAEWIKRNKQAVTAFPSPKECNAAIKAVRTKHIVSSFAYGETVTKENFGALAVQYCAANNPGRNPLVIKIEDSGWDDWLAYYERLDMKAVLSVMRDRKTWTVPSLFPSQFDPSFARTFQRQEPMRRQLTA